MIVGCYSLDLYCDNAEPSETGSVYDRHGHRYNEFPRQFQGESGAECREDARRKGWKLVLSASPQRAYCPACMMKERIAKS